MSARRGSLQPDVRAAAAAGPERRPARLRAAPPPPPAPAEPPRAFLLRYDFDGLVVFRHAGALTEILDAARALKARAVSITGHRGSVLLSNGTTLTEQASVARRRAEQIATLLRGAGLTDVDYEIDWQDEPGTADGRNDAALRRVTVELTP